MRTEYKVIEESDSTSLTAALVAASGEGWRPILMSSAHVPRTTSYGHNAATNIVTSVILERKV